MRRDPLAAILRLRALEVAFARRDLAERATGAAAADARAQAAAAALRDGATERLGDFADSHAAWQPRARADRDRAAGEARLADRAVEASRAALAGLRVAERAVEALLERRAEDARAASLRREQLAIDEAAQRRR